MSEASDRLAIQDVLHLHSRGLDRRNESVLKNCYWPDAEVDYGVFKGSAHQFAEIVLPALGEQYQLTRHVLHNTLVEFKAEEALSESLVDASHLLHGAGEELVFGARYLDKLQKRGGEWKILHRQVITDWCQIRALKDESDAEAYAAFARGTNNENDPLYAFLAQD